MIYKASESMWRLVLPAKYQDGKIASIVYPNSKITCYFYLFDIHYIFRD